MVTSYSQRVTKSGFSKILLLSKPVNSESTKHLVSSLALSGLKLKNIIPLITQLDFHQIHLQSQEPITKQCWDLYNKGYKQIDIQKELKISHASVQRYLAKGKELGVIDYQTTAKKHEQRFQLFLKLWEEGVRKNQVLADKIGVSVSTILDYKHKANIL